MWTSCFLLLMLGVGVDSLSCSVFEKPCGPSACYDPTTQGCASNNSAIQCRNSCNDVCYPDSQYCYNNTKVCFKNESVCDITKLSSFTWFSLGLTCYNPSEYNCYNNTLCSSRYTCGTQCINSYYSVCVNNQTICNAIYDSSAFSYINICGPQKECYDNRTKVCLNGTIICEGLNAQLCGPHCFDFDRAVCVNGIIQCRNSCGGSCYSSSQYCYNGTLICNNNELVCDNKFPSLFYDTMGDLNCYDPSKEMCFNNTLCSMALTCGMECLTIFYATCVKNKKFCPIIPWDPNYSSTELDLCGPQQHCYDTRESICVNETTVCPKFHTELCGTICFNPNTQICINSTVRCLNSCNGVCYSNSQYCYNNTTICNNTESICDIKTYSYFLQNFVTLPPGYPPRDSSPPFGLTCYDRAQFKCYNNSLCYNQHTCGTQCLIDYDSVCVNNRTICSRISYSSSGYDNVCGPQEECYDNRTSVCLNGATVCNGLNAQLCGSNCFNPDKEACVNGIVQCISSCNGICYSSSQYCYNNAIVCNNNESVCDVKYSGYFTESRLGLNCYDRTRQSCLNSSLCYKQYVCGFQCRTAYESACVKNQTICFKDYNNFVDGESRFLDYCGPQKQCYDNSRSVCLGNNGTLCPIGNRLCSGVCYNPQIQYCPTDPGVPYCPNKYSTTTSRPPAQPGR